MNRNWHATSVSIFWTLFSHFSRRFKMMSEDFRTTYRIGSIVFSKICICIIYICIIYIVHKLVSGSKKSYYYYYSKSYYHFLKTVVHLYLPRTCQGLPDTIQTPPDTPWHSFLPPRKALEEKAQTEYSDFKTPLTHQSFQPAHLRGMQVCFFGAFLSGCLESGRVQ